MGKLPRLEIEETKVEALDEELYSVTVYLTNTGWFPTSTAQGRRARTAWPISVELQLSDEQLIFSGRAKTGIPFIGGSGDTQKVQWTIKGKKGSSVLLTAHTPRLNPVKTTIVLQ
jgi:hypothetical protein